MFKDSKYSFRLELNELVFLNLPCLEVVLFVLLRQEKDLEHRTA